MERVSRGSPINSYLPSHPIRMCTVPAVRAAPYITICMHTNPCVSLVLLLFVPRSDRHCSHGQSSPVRVLPDYNVCQGLCKLPHGSTWFLPHTQFTCVRTHRTCLHELPCIWHSRACRYCASRDFMLKQYKHWIGWRRELKQKCVRFPAKASK